MFILAHSTLLPSIVLKLALSTLRSLAGIIGNQIGKIDCAVRENTGKR